jgi:septum formation protein
LPFVVRPPAIDESVGQGEAPEPYVERIAREKLSATLEALESSEERYGGVLVADTAVILGERILGKPSGRSEAMEMLSALSGATHRVLTAYGLSARHSGRSFVRVVSTDVVMRAATKGELENYVDTGEGADKAGSYAIQGVGAFLVESIHGSYSNVVGLPICELVVDLKALGLLEQYP